MDSEASERSTSAKWKMTGAVTAAAAAAVLMALISTEIEIGLKREAGKN